MLSFVCDVVGVVGGDGVYDVYDVVIRGVSCCVVGVGDIGSVCVDVHDVVVVVGVVAGVCVVVDVVVVIVDVVVVTIADLFVMCGVCTLFDAAGVSCVVVGYGVVDVDDIDSIGVGDAVVDVVVVVGVVVVGGVDVGVGGVVVVVAVVVLVVDFCCW